MQKEKKVSIELPALDGTKPDTPIKHKKHRGSPTTNQFAFSPKFAPQLCKEVEKFKWNSVKKTLDVVIRETPNFETHDFIEHVKQQKEAQKKGPFNIDIDNDHIIVEFFEGEGAPIAKLDFEGLNIVKHEVAVGYHVLPETLKHKLRISYEKCKKMDLEDAEFRIFDMDHQNEVADDEWQSVEDA